MHDEGRGFLASAVMERSHSLAQMMNIASAASPEPTYVWSGACGRGMTFVTVEVRLVQGESMNDRKC